MTGSETELLDLIGYLHEGVVDESSWFRGLDGICDHFGGQLLLGSMYADRPFELVGRRMLDSVLASISGPLANPLANPWVAAAWRLPIRQAVTADDIGGEAKLRESPIWEHAYQPAGVDKSMGAVLERLPDRMEVLMIQRSGNDYGSPEQRWLTAIAPHLARAWRVRRAVQNWQSLADGMAAALDRLERGVVITGEGGEIRHANRAAERLLSAGDGIDATRGRLRGTRPRDTETLTNIIDRATSTGIGRDSRAVDAMALPRSNDRPPLAVVAEPLAPAHGDRLGQTGHGAILFISDASASSTPAPERLSLVYNLTAAEAQLAARVASGEGVTAAASALGITTNTAKTHLRAIYGKVGVTRQAELVRRIIADVGGLADESAHGPRGTTGD